MRFPVAAIGALEEARRVLIGERLAKRLHVGIGDKIDHLSTGGGASLEYVQGLELPGVAALEESA